jgi:hypothetical protein
MGEQFAGYASVLGQNPVGLAQRIGGTGTEVAEIADRRCDNVESGQQLLVHQLWINLFQSNRKRVIVLKIHWPGERAMIPLLGASAIILVGLQASIDVPRDAFRACLKEAAVKASGDKVTADAIEAYLKTACSGQLGSLRGALVSFDLKNGMARKAAESDASSTVDDYMSGPIDHYKFSAPAAAPTAAPAPAATAPAMVTPAAASATPTQPPKPPKP